MARLQIVWQDLRHDSQYRKWRMYIKVGAWMEISIKTEDTYRIQALQTQLLGGEDAG